MTRDQVRIQEGVDVCVGEVSIEQKPAEVRISFTTLGELGIPPFSTVILHIDSPEDQCLSIALCATPDARDDAPKQGIGLAPCVSKTFGIHTGAVVRLQAPKQVASRARVVKLGVVEVAGNNLSPELSSSKLNKYVHQLLGIAVCKRDLLLIEFRGRLCVLRVDMVENEGKEMGLHEEAETRAVIDSSTELNFVSSPEVLAPSLSQQQRLSNVSGVGPPDNNLYTGSRRLAGDEGVLESALRRLLEQRVRGRLGQGVERRAAAAVAGMLHLAVGNVGGLALASAGGVVASGGGGESALSEGMAGLRLEHGSEDRQAAPNRESSAGGGAPGEGFGGRGLLVCGAAGSGRTGLLRAIEDGVRAMGGEAKFVDGSAAVLARRRGERGAVEEVVDFVRGLARRGARGARSEGDGGEGHGAAADAGKQAWGVLLVDDLDDMFEASEGGAAGVGAAVGAELVLALKGLRRSEAEGRAGGWEGGGTRRGCAWCVIASARAGEGVPAWAKRSADFQGNLRLRGPGPEAGGEMLAGLSRDSQGSQLGAAAHGYLVGDLVRHYRTAVLSSVGAGGAQSRTAAGQGGEEGGDAGSVANGWVQAWRKCRGAVAVARGSDMEEIEAEVGWEEVRGCRGAKEALERAVLWPLQRQGQFTKLRVQPVGGVLLTGPPGSGKSMLAQSVAAASPCRAVYVKCPLLLKSYLGESELAVRELFAAAREMAPCVLVLDELDAIAMSRSLSGGGDQAQSVESRLLSTLLNEMDGVTGRGGHVTFIGCTADPSTLDAALLRPGRFDEIIELGPPEYEDRVDLMRFCLRNTPSVRLDLEEVSGMMALSAFSAAQIAAVCASAALAALEEDNEVSTAHVKSALMEHLGRLQRVAIAAATPHAA